MKKVWLLSFTLAFSAQAQEAPLLAEAFQSKEWSLMVMASTSMPRASLVELTRASGMAGAKLIIRGFPGKTPDMQSAQLWTQALLDECCNKAPRPAIEIDPKKFERFNVKAVPAFVITQSDYALNANTWSSLAGDMTLGDALKTFAQTSKLEHVRKQAQIFYYRLANRR